MRATARSVMSRSRPASSTNGCGKGSAWGDYDGDGRLDLFVSNMGQECRLYHNEGNGTFRDVALELGVTGDATSFACWFWDYDNDGRLDLYVNDYRTARRRRGHCLGLTSSAPAAPASTATSGPTVFAT